MSDPLASCEIRPLEFLSADLRRSGIGQIRSAGVAAQTIIRMSGHRTTATFTRIDIVSTGDMREALRRGAATTGEELKVETTQPKADAK